MSYIEVAIQGSVGSLPTERQTQTGKKYVTLTIVVREKNSEDAEWVNVSAFEQVAAGVPTDLVKGERLYVTGKARLNRWVAKDGQSRVNLQVTAAEVLVLDRIGRKRRKPKAARTDQALASTGQMVEAARHWQHPLDADRAEIPFAPEMR